MKLNLPYLLQFLWISSFLIPSIGCTADYPELGWLSQKGDTEYNRTVMSIHALEVFLNGKYEDYLEFISHQPKGSELQWQSFLAIQNHMHSVLSNYKKISQDNLQKLLEFAIIFRDVTTSQTTSDRIGAILGKACFQSDLLSHFNEFGKEIFPSYHRFSTQERELISEWVGLINYEEVSRLEGGPEMFTKLKNSDFEMSMFLYMCQVAGAMAHMDKKSSLTYNEDMHQTLLAIKNACYLLKDNSEMDAYNHYLGVRAKWLGLDSGSPLHRTLTRVASMLMLYNKEEGRILKESFLRLDPENLALVVEEFNINRKEHSWKLPSSLPAILVNFSTGMLQGTSQKESLDQTIKVLAKILKCQKAAFLRKEIPLNFDPISKIAKDDPKTLIDGEISVDECGNIILLVH